MTTLREAAQQALEALEGCVKALDALHAPGDSIYTRASDSADRAEIALRKALEQQEQKPYCYAYEYDCAFGVHIQFHPRPYDGKAGPDRAVPLYAHPPRRETEQEPVAWIQPDHLQKARQAPFLCRVEPTKRMSDFVPIYTHPPRREWVSLTEEEREQATGWSVEHIEAALKERNT